MNILIIGCGGREHAIIKKLAMYPTTPQNLVYVIGEHRNPEIVKLAYEYLITDSIDETIKMAKSKRITFAIIGPEKYLELGWADALISNGIPVIGPTKLFAMIETSKSFARTLLDSRGKYQYQPKYHVMKKTEEPDNAVIDIILQKYGENVVLKADGLSGGKGVKVYGDHLSSSDETRNCLIEMLKTGDVVIEQKLYGQEFSLMSMTDGKSFVHFPLICDFKRLNNGDKGPNTGGMGCISYANGLLPGITDEDVTLARSLNVSTVESLNDYFGGECSPGETGKQYKGVIYGSYMKTSDGLKIIEYNARFGDPECINAMELLAYDFASLCHHIINGKLNEIADQVTFHKQATVSKYLAPIGYPNKIVSANCYPNCESNSESFWTFPENSKNASIIYANVTNGWGDNTDENSNKLFPMKSRAAAVVSMNPSLHRAERSVEWLIRKVKGDFHYRSDIGKCKVEEQCKKCNRKPRKVKKNRLKKMHTESVTDKINGSHVVTDNLNSEVTDNLNSEISVTVKSDGLGYAATGVNIDEGNLTVQKIKDSVVSTYNENVKSKFGDFSGIMSMPTLQNENGWTGGVYKITADGLTKPIQSYWLVFSTDGVGTKPEVVVGHLGLKGYFSLGMDIVNHCVNDTLVKGAHPLAFLDFYGSSVLNSDHVASLVAGIASACKDAGCVLIGGETAEMPGTYQENKCEIVGTMIGTVDPTCIINGQEDIKPGNIVMCLPSSGPHTNGYSMIRQVLSLCPELLSDKEFMDAICKPHRSYLPEISAMQKKGVKINGLCHITGGGIIENPKRVLPEDCDIAWESWEWPKIYKMIQKVGNINTTEMLRIFNCGLGMLIIVDHKYENTLKWVFKDMFKVGTVTAKVI